jgi:hypothetical protein
MRKDSRLACVRKRTLVLSALAVMVPLTALGVASPALASNPWEVFKQCPTSFPGVEYCTYATTTSGEFAIGKTKVPIEKGTVITLQGGAASTGEPGVYFLLPAANGESLSKTPLNVPGGLLDLINCKEIKGEGLFEKGERVTCEFLFESGVTQVTATTELVANEKNPAILNINNLFGETGTALTLPVRIHLKNALLGEGCYVGSESSPIELHLSTAPPKGKVGDLVTEGEGGIVGIKEISLADTKFSVPVAEGCGGFFSFLIDPIVDAKLGLPSKEGNNVAVLSGEQRIASAEEVKKHGF